jgi:hypothetical protein
MAYSIVTKETYSNWKLVCLQKETDSLWWTQKDLLNCNFIPNKDYPSFNASISQWTWDFIQNYDLYVPKIEHLFLDMLFILGLFIFFYGLIKFVFKVLFK